MRRLKETISTRDRPYSGRPRVTIPNQDHEIRLTYIQNRFGSVLQAAGTVHGRHNPRIKARKVLRHVRENYITGVHLSGRTVAFATVVSSARVSF